MPFQTVDWVDGKIRMIDQTRLPDELVYLNVDQVDDLAEAICSLRIRGAPAIGVAAALGVALAANLSMNQDQPAFNQSIRHAMDVLGRTRPTAVNLFWALNRMEKVLSQAEALPPSEIQEKLLKEALALLDEDRRICHQLGQNGIELIPDPASILTHCNAGGLAASEYGTALAVIYEAVARGKDIRVFVDDLAGLNLQDFLHFALIGKHADIFA